MAMARAHRLRRGRYSNRNQVYLCTTAARHRRPVFVDLRAGRIVVDEMRACDSRGMTETWAFVVMPDHVHWLFQLTGDEALSAIIARMKARSARGINLLTDAEGAIWQRGFHDHWIRDEESVLRIARYVVANPVRAGLVESVRDYPLWDAKWV